MDIDTLAGDALDAAVVSKVLGRQNNSFIRLRYSSDVGSAWDLVKAVTSEHPTVEFRLEHAEGWLQVVFFDPRTDISGQSRSRTSSATGVAATVCRAALRFVAKGLQGINLSVQVDPQRGRWEPESYSGSLPGTSRHG